MIRYTFSRQFPVRHQYSAQGLAMKLTPHVSKRGSVTHLLLGALLIALSWGSSLQAVLM
jgi:hypothetical protein